MALWYISHEISSWFCSMISRVCFIQQSVVKSCVWWMGKEVHMMTSLNGNIFRVTGPSCGEFTGHRWIVLFHNYFSSSGEQPEQRILACKQNNQLWVVYSILGGLFWTPTGSQRTAWGDRISETRLFPSQRPVTHSFDVFFDLHLKKRLSNNRDAGDLRHHHAHYDVTVMILRNSPLTER